MFKSVLGWIKRKADPPNYKIVHDPELGYVSCYFDGIVGWRVIEADASLSVHPDHAMRFKSCWCDSEAEAGARINKHSTGRAQRTIWVG